MKILLTSFCMVFSMGFCFAQTEPNPDAIEKIASGKQGFYKKLLKGDSKFVGNNYDLKYHRFQWYINPDTLYIKGSVTSYFKTTEDNVTQINFELSHELTVDSVIYHGNGLLYNIDLNDVLTIDMGTVLPLDNFDSITVYYQGSPPQGSYFESFVKAFHDTDNIPVPIIWTLSEPYGAKSWWPCKNDLSDKIDSIDIIVTTPQQYRAAANGMLISETLLDTNKTYHWKHRYPIATYLIGIAVTNYSVYSDYAVVNGDSIEILNYVYPESLAESQANSPNIIPVMQLYDSMFTEYPFINERYGHAQFSWGGGMEHQTMTFLHDFGHELMAHELSHQWFGDMITCASWHDIWLNEGFATYVTGLTYEHMFNGYWWKTWKGLQIMKITEFPDGSVYCVDTTSVERVFSSRLSYRKGAALLHMLRWITGDSCFFLTMRNYLNDASLIHNYATSANFISHAETVSGMDLTGFFNDWLYGEGYPIYSIICGQEESNDSMAVAIIQTQSHPSVSFFEMPVPIKFKNENKDTLIVFNNTYSGQVFKTHLSFHADSAFFDPDMWITCKLDTLILSVKENPDNNKSLPVIYPNPFKDQTNIEYTLIKPSDVLIEVYNTSGKKIEIIVNERQGKGNHRYKFDFSDYAAGIYYLKTVIDGHVVTEKFTKVE